MRGSISISGGQLNEFKITFYFLAIVAALWLVTVGALLFALQAFSTSTGEATSVADGSIYLSALALTIIIQVAIIFPGLLLLQPYRLWRTVRTQRHAITPRQRFRSLYPRTYDPSYTTGACVLAIVFASTFSLIFPLIGPAVVVLLFLTLIGKAHAHHTLPLTCLSSPIYCWIFSCTFKDRRGIADLACSSVWHTACITAHLAGAHFLESALLDRG